EVMLVDLKHQKVKSRVTIDNAFYGLCFSADGKQLFVSGGEYEVVHAFDFADGLLSRQRQLPIVKPAEKFIPAGLAVSSSGKILFVAGPWGDAVCMVPLDAGVPLDGATKNTLIDLGKNSYPYTCILDKTGKRLFVSLWAKAEVGVIDIEERKVVAS